MSQTHCALTELLVTECGHCRPRAYSPPPINGTIRLGGEFGAKYPGLCDLCDRRIEVNSWIAPILDDLNRVDGYACQTCIDGGAVS